MRGFFLVLMITLLPLRGWAGDVMAIRMATHPAVAAVSLVSAAVRAEGAQTASHGVVESGHADCTGHAGVAQGPDDSSGAATGTGHCTSCASCQVCTSIALVVPPMQWEGASVAYDSPRDGSARFFSAVPAPGFKPPIF